MERILIDMDDVMAETGLKILTTYNKLYETSYTALDFEERDFHQLFTSEKFEMVKKEILKKGFFLDLEVKIGAVDVIKELYDKYDVYIVSAATEYPNSLSEKIEWLASYFPFIEWKKIVFCGYKHMIKADIMIDDHTKNLDYFEGKTKLLFDALHNKKVTGYQRIKNWNEIAEILL